MKQIYLLRLKFLPRGYDYNEAMVIVADNERQARSFANVKAKEEGKLWHLKKKVSCEVVKTELSHIVCISFIAG